MRKKYTHIAIVIIVLIGLLICVREYIWAATPKAQTANFAVEQYAINEGTGWVFGIVNDVQRASIGGGIVGIVLSSNPQTSWALFQGFLYLELWQRPAPDYQYDIAGIFAREYGPDGPQVYQQTWQQDSDPYFEWSTKAPTIDVAGYSVSFDELPDEFIDVTEQTYQVPDLYLVDGMHTFYVIAKSTGGTFGLPGAFEIWVDATRPVISEALPENGSIVANRQPAIQAVLFEATSGLEEANCVFTIQTRLDEYTKTGTYDEESGLLVFIPEEEYPEGLVTVRLEVTDRAGNQAVPLFWSFTISDTMTAAWVLINDDEPTTTTPKVNLSFSVTHLFTDIQQMVISNDGVFDSEVWEPFDGSGAREWQLEPYAGVQTVYMKFRDINGTESDVYSDSIMLILEVPNTFITEAPPSITMDQDAEFIFTSTRPDALFQYKLDTDAWSEMSTDVEVSYSGLSMGNHYFQARAGFDLDGNGTIDEDEIDPSPASVSWTIGTVAKMPLEPEQPIRYYKEE